MKTLQNKLVKLGYLDMSSGGWGYYGPKTLDAVNRYKKEKGLGNTGKDAGVVGKETWESLGLLWRTQKDIDAGVQIVTRGTEQYYDLSNAINKVLWTAKSDFEEHKDDFFLEKWSWFTKLVGNSGVWNIKKDEETWTNTLNISSNSFNKKFLLFGKVVDREILGNITYGYFGTAAGLSIHELLGGSMVNDVMTHGFDNLSNEYNDHSSIKMGIDWYKSSNT